MTREATTRSAGSWASVKGIPTKRTRSDGPSGQALEPLGGKLGQRFESGFRDVEALQSTHPEVPEGAGLRPRVPALGDDRNPELSADVDPAGQDGTVDRIVLDAANHVHVELDQIGLDVRDQVEARGAGPEVVDGGREAAFSVVGNDGLEVFAVDALEPPSGGLALGPSRERRVRERAVRVEIGDRLEGPTDRHVGPTRRCDRGAVHRGGRRRGGPLGSRRVFAQGITTGAGLERCPVPPSPSSP